MTVSIIGVDPGGTTGVALLQLRPGVDGTPRYCAPKAFQVASRRAEAGRTPEDTIKRLQDEFKLLFAYSRRPGHHLFFAVEAFIISQRAARSRDTQSSAIARKIIGQLYTLAYDLDARLWERSASQVKLWATDARLRRAGGAVRPALELHNGEGRPEGLWPSMFDATAKLPHARDAARHALFAARHDLQWPDPLSRAYWGPLEAVTSKDPGE